MVTPAATLYLALTCLGAGAALLRRLEILPGLNAAERIGWSFTLGFGLLGWLMFWLALAGALSPAAIGLGCAPGLAGLWALRRLPAPAKGPEGAAFWRLAAMGAGLAVMMAGDLMEALAPPADADSLAYHFALPRHILEAGHLLFVERALDAASPQLVQMTYLAALGLGGEQALTLWCMLSGWALGLPVFGLARRHLPADWSLALASMVIGLPAVLYGAGTGQVEVRLALFVLVALVAAIEARRRDRTTWAVLAGLVGGFLMAAKYTGLLPVAVCGLVVLAGGGGLRRALWFTAALLAAGSQWYGWNAANTGDPLFPLLFGKIPYAATTHWNAAQAGFMAHSLNPMELAVPRSLGWLLAYPVQATLAGHPVFESGRTGFGLAGLLLLPFALAGAWTGRHRLARHPLTWVAAMVMAAYALWFFLGPSQRVRHLLPLLPPLLVALGAGAHAACRRWRLEAPLWAGMALVLMLQLGGQAVFSLKFARFLAQGRDRDAFLAGNVNYFGLAQWLNGHLGPGDKVMLTVREIDYLVTIPSFQANPYIQSVVEIRPDNRDPARFLAQLRAQGITHVVAGPAEIFAGPLGAPHHLGLELVAAGCAGMEATVSTPPAVPSRTLATERSGVPAVFEVFRLNAPGQCPLDRSRL